MFFDEQFHFVSGNASRVGTSGSVKDHWTTDAQLQNIIAPQNGYIFVYVSNESNFDVFFDNLQVVDKPGAIIEENHYYPFGLTMAGISSQAAGGLENKHKYNGIELDTSFGLNEYEAPLRDLDAQVGRWWQVDPETEGQEMWSPYTSNNDNPILYQDPRGNEGEVCCQWLSDIVTTVVATTSVAVDNALGTNVTGAIANSGAIPSSQTATWNNAVTTSNKTFVVAGTITAIGGGGVATGAAGVTVATGGASIEVTGPAFVAGTTAAVAGTWVAANATKNLNQGNGLIKSTSNSNTSNSSGRSQNKRKPDPNASGDHTVVDKNGNTTYKENPQNPSGFDEVKRTDVKGKPHTNPDGTVVPTPHVHEKGKNNVVPAVKGVDYN